MSVLTDFVVERESIRRKKLAGLPAPWTENEILRKYRFTNIRRSDDRVSQWLIKNTLTEEKLAEKGLESFVMWAALCRQINWPPTIQALMSSELWTNNPDWEQIGAYIDELKGSGELDKVWTSAYLVRAKPGHNKGKGHYVAVEVVGKPLQANMLRIMEALNTKRKELVWEALVGCFGWGSFSAGQVVADLGYTSLLKDAPDSNTWSPVGPGSRRGFNRLLGRPLKQKVLPQEWQTCLHFWRQDIIQALGPEYGDLTLHDVQNSLCELDKYLRVKAGEGRPRANYKPETAF